MVGTHAHRSQEGSLSIYYRQVVALCHKNLKLFWRRPLVLIFRVLLLPIILSVLATVFRHVGSALGFSLDDNGGISDLRAIRSMESAIGSSSSDKFVFARNGQGRAADQVIDRFLQRTGVSNFVRIEDPVDIMTECRMMTTGASECYASIIFNSANNSAVDYIIALNPNDYKGESDWRSHKSTLQDKIFPLQFAMDSAIANLPEGTMVDEQSYAEDRSFLYRYYDQGQIAPNGEVGRRNTNGYYYFVAVVLAPFFVLIFIEMVFHVCGFLTRERESGVTELLTTQGCRQTPQIISSFVSFWLLYIVTWIATGIVIGEVLFVASNTGFMVLFQVLAGTALLAWCMFLSTFFTRGHFSSPVCAVLTIGVAMVVFNYFFDRNDFTNIGMDNEAKRMEMMGLAAVFPPFTYAFLIGDMARIEGFASLGFNLSRNVEDLKALTSFASMSPYLYIIFFLIQTPLYLGLAVGAHFSIWHIPYTVKRIEEGSGLAMRISGLNKTFKPWFKKSKGKAVDDLSLQIQHGTVLCLLGPNGGGKTTTLKCIGGVVKADKGSSMELGCDRTDMGYCPQHNVIWPNLTVREHVEIWLMIKGQRLSKTERHAAVEEMVRECDLIEKIDAQSSTLSGGQKRKLQLAIAFIGGSRIICIDEASSGVDPLSRQNIWHIIQQGTASRTILLTTHFLDEADVLADYVVIMSKGKLVVEGSSTALKAQHGDGYAIYEDSTLTNQIGHAKTSAEASDKLGELSRGNPTAKYEVGFPTLEQVFLKVANGESLGSENEASSSDDEAVSTNQENTATLLDHGRPINKFRQLWVLYKKRYKVLPHNWLALIVTLLIPIAVAIACRSGTSFSGDWEEEGLHNCQFKIDAFEKDTENIRSMASRAASRATPTTNGRATASGSLSSDYEPTATAALYESLEAPGFSYGSYLSSKVVVGPPAVFRNGSENYRLLTDIFGSTYDGGDQPVIYADGVQNYTQSLPEGSDYTVYKVAGIYAQEGENLRIAITPPFGTNRLEESNYGYNSLSVANNILSRNNDGPQIRTDLRQMREKSGSYDFLAVPFALFLTMAIIAGFTASIIYPTYERIQKTRSLQYSNGVSPVSLWSAYLLWEFQWILVVAVAMLAIFTSGRYTSLFYGLGYIFGATVLTGIATVLGCFILSLYFSSKLAYVLAAIIHLALLLVYLVGVVLVATYAPALERFNIHNQLHAGLGLTSPAANLARAFILGTNGYTFLCGQFGEIATPENPFAFRLFGGVYFNLILQIIFLVFLLFALEYSLFTRIYYRFRKPTHKRTSISSDQIELASASRKSVGSDKSLLECFSVSKSFKGVEAVREVTLSVSSNETMALLGPNGAGKSTTINMIRGQFKPDAGDILVKDKSVLSQLVEARAVTGVCPQEDAVDDLTVFSTLKFYAEVRGVPDPTRNAEIVMRALGIQDFKSKRVSKLSGGTKRKLSVAIALLGNPPVLLLDEPSTGLDAVSKRTLWKTLRMLSRDRATLLTTHSMEEVEALATTVSIIAVRLLASGTTASLREEYGGFWHIRAVIPPAYADKIETTIYGIFGNSVSEYITHSGQIRFSVKKAGMDFAKTMNAVEDLKREGKVEEYSINGTTLQEVFLNVCGKAKFQS